MRITLVHSGALGDTLLLVPLIQGLRQTFGDARVTVVTRVAFGKLLCDLGQIEAFADGEGLENARWFGEEAAAEFPLWSDCELLLSAVSDGRDGWARNALRSPAKRVCFFEPRPPADYPRHVTCFQREQLLVQGIRLPELIAPPIRLFLNSEDLGTKDHVVIHPGSGGRAKCWGWEKFLRLGEKLAERGEACSFVFGEAEMARWPTEVITRIQGAFPTLIEPPLAELAERLRAAKLYVGNDSGVTHLAGMLGVGTLALFGPSSAIQWRPLGQKVRVLQAGRMGDILEGDVWRAVGEMLAWATEK